MNRDSTYQWVFLLLLGMVSLSACLDRVDLRIPTADNPASLIVEGLISEGRGPHFVHISRTTELNVRQNEPVEVSNIWIENQKGEREDLQFVESGTYQLEGHTLVGTIGDQYRLTFTLHNGQKYQSDWEVLAPVSRIDSVYFEVVFEDRFNSRGLLVGKNFIDFYTDISLTSLPESPYMRWKVDRWWLINEFIRSSPPSKACYVNTPLLSNNQILLFDGRNVESERWLKQYIGSAEVDFRFFEKTYINLFQYSLSPAAYAYWQDLEEVLNQTGDVFDTPPAAIQGNLHNLADKYELVLGFFGASAVETVHFPVFRQDLPVRVDWICGIPQSNYLYSFHPCIECTVVPGSITERPDYW